MPLSRPALSPFAALLLASALPSAAGCPRSPEPPPAEPPRAPPPEIPEPSAPPAAITGPRVRIIGTVQDGGLPHVACTCPRCEAAREPGALARHVAALAIVLPGNGEVLLVDATPDLPAQIELLRDVRDGPPGRVDRAPVDGVFLTHAHLGHYTGLGYLGFEAVHAGGIPVWSTPAMAGFLETHAPWSELVRRREIELRPTPAGTTVPLADGVEVLALPVPHRDELADTVAYLIRGPRQAVLYAPDTDGWAAWDPSPESVLAGVDVALLDGTFYDADELPGRAVSSIGHPLVSDSIVRFRPMIEATGVRVLFTHLNHSNPALSDGSAARRALEEAGFEVATDGLEIPL